MSEISNQEKLNEIYELASENNEILRGIRRTQRIGAVLRGLYWLIIIISLGGVYLFIRPLVGLFTGDESSLDGPVQGVRNSIDKSPTVKNILNVVHGTGTSATSTQE